MPGGGMGAVFQLPSWLSQLFGQGQQAGAVSSTNQFSPSYSPTNTASPTNTVSPSQTLSSQFSPTNTNTNTFNPNITVNPATIPNSYQFNNGGMPSSGGQSLIDLVSQYGND